MTTLTLRTPLRTPSGVHPAAFTRYDFLTGSRHAEARAMRNMRLWRRHMGAPNDTHSPTRGASLINGVIYHVDGRTIFISA